jgi:phosphinothricin acetyltransferase
MTIIRCSREGQAAEILAILNDAILTSTAVFGYHARPLSSMDAWFDAKERGNYPVLGALDDDSRLLGFSTYGVFRDRPAYHYSIEHSVYVQREARGQGIGAILMRRLIDEARKQDYHLMVGGIELTNHASIRLHESLGFTHAGTIRQAGYKFSRWLDLAFYQLILDTPTQPVEG